MKKECGQSDLEVEASCCGSKKSHKHRTDYLFLIGLVGVFVGYILHLSGVSSGLLGEFASSIFRLLNQMWWGLALGVIALGFIGKIPKEIVQGFMGRNDSFSGILRACVAGLFLDLCNHGILMVAAKLYERGVSYGQVLAFLIASPWNSLSLTLILFSLIGVKWTLLYILGSLIIAIATGWFAVIIGKRFQLPTNPNSISLESDYNLKNHIKRSWSSAKINRHFLTSALLSGLKESKMIVKWILVGTLLAACLATFVPPHVLSNYFGPSFLGVILTLGVATVVEVCSEGSAPIASELVTGANAPGNGFTFLMAGAATDYTEIAILRQVTGSWKLTLLLPILTIPQVIMLGWFMNMST